MAAGTVAEDDRRRVALGGLAGLSRSRGAQALQARPRDRPRHLVGARQLSYLELGFFFGLVTFVQIVVVAPLLILLPLLRVGWAGTRRR